MSAAIKVGDVWEGVGGMRVRVRIMAEPVDGRVKVVLVRSGNEKTLTTRTLLTAYRLMGSV